jgi:hypothetical protein
MPDRCDPISGDMIAYGLRERLQVLESVLTQAQLTLLVATREPVNERLAQALGRLSLCCKAAYDNRTAAISKYTPQGEKHGHG